LGQCRQGERILEETGRIEAVPLKESQWLSAIILHCNKSGRKNRGRIRQRAKEKTVLKTVRKGFTGMGRRIAEFRGARNGNVAMMFAITAIPLLAMVGGAIDYSNAYRVKERLQTAVDSAALAVARDGADMDDDQIEELANAFFNAHFDPANIGTVTSIQVSRNDATVELHVTGTVPTWMLSVIGVDTFHLAADTTVLVENTTAEIALVLDNSGSMSGSKISSLRSAANLLVDTLYGSVDDNPNLMFSLVPFTSAVNVGTQNKNASWIDGNGNSPLHSLEFSVPTSRFELYDRISNVSWPGCVEARSYPMDVDDTEPNLANPETLFVPWFAPDEPDSGTYWNNYLNDQTGSSDKAVRQKNIGKYTPGVWAGASSLGSSYGRGPAFLCNSRPIMALTSDKSAVKAAINDMEALGGTNITEGLIWGWRTLSPGEPFTEGRPYGEETNRKVLIVLTDGSNDWSNQSNHNRSYYAPYGYLTHGRLGITSGSKSEIIDKMNERLQEACANVKARAIRVYSITFGDLDNTTKDLMRGCATQPELYFHAPSSSDIQATFEAIAADINNMRILR
jgi:Flp pilus assembly protein TadG